jgi:hypothetical protein
MSQDNEQGSTVVAQQMIAEAKKQLAQQIAKWLIATIAALVAAAVIGWWTVLLPELKRIFGGAPVGSVVAFDLETCPNGDWEIFEAAKGKFLVAADGSRFSYRVPGGRPEVVLSRGNMPPVSITVPVFRSTEGALTAGGYSFDRYIGGDGSGAAGSLRTLTMTSNGTAAAFEILPPFLPLTLCEKVR